MADIVAGHQISFRFRDADNKPTGKRFIIYREGTNITLEFQTPYGGAAGHISHILGSDTCNNFTKWLEAVHAFLTLDIPTLDTIKEEGNREQERAHGAHNDPALAGKTPGVIT